VKIATIATKECEVGLQRAVASLRNHGNTSVVDVYVPEGYTPPECEGIEIVKCQNWWEGMPGVSGVRHNTPALAKPEILLSDRYKDGEQVLYFDGADVLFFCDPEVAFSGQERPIMAYPWAKRAVRAPLDGRMPVAPYYNNGVWSFIAGEEARRFGHVFVAMEFAGVVRDIWETDPVRPLVGDQEAFNAAATTMPHIFQHLPHEMNYRGGTTVSKIKIVNGVPMGVNNLPVLVAHATGGKPIPEHLVKLATEPDMKRKEKWAIVIPAYKAAPFIMECLNSLPKGDDVRVLIGLDACPETLKAIKKVEGLNVEVYMFPKVGPYVIRNTLAELAEDCDNILFFDADDWMMPDGFDKIRASKTTVTRFPFVMVKDGEVVPSNIHRSHGCFAIDRECFLWVKGFKPWPLSADSEFMFRTEHDGIDTETLNEPVFFRRKHQNNLTVHPDTRPGSALRNKYDALVKTFKEPSHLHICKDYRRVKEIKKRPVKVANRT